MSSEIIGLILASLKLTRLLLLIFFGEFTYLQNSHCLSHTSGPFCSGYFRDGGVTNYLPSQPQAIIFLISAT
jgi:hypothetical protein